MLKNYTITKEPIDKLFKTPDKLQLERTIDKDNRVWSIITTKTDLLLVCNGELENQTDEIDETSISKINNDYLGLRIEGFNNNDLEKFMCFIQFSSTQSIFDYSR